MGAGTDFVATLWELGPSTRDDRSGGGDTAGTIGVTGIGMGSHFGAGGATLTPEGGWGGRTLAGRGCLGRGIASFGCATALAAPSLLRGCFNNPSPCPLPCNERGKTFLSPSPLRGGGREEGLLNGFLTPLPPGERGKE